MSSVGILSQVVEDIRNAVDDQGAKGCYRKTLVSFAKKSGLPIEGLWSVVDHILNGDNPEKVLKRLHKSYGGNPGDWAKWWSIALTKPDC